MPNSINPTTQIDPFGTVSKMAEVTIESSSSTIFLASLNPGKHTFSTWIKGTDGQTISLSLDDNVIYEMPITNSWGRFVTTFDVENACNLNLFVPIGLFYIFHIQCELGDKATDWKKAPEDVRNDYTDVATDKTNDVKSDLDKLRDDFNSSNDDIYNKIYHAESLIEQTPKNVVVQVTDNYGRTTLKQETSGWTWELSDYVNNTNQAIADAKTNLSNDISNLGNSLSNEIDSVSKTANDLSDNVNRYMTFNSNGLTIGAIDRPMSVNITNDQLSFEENGNSVAYVNSYMLYVNNAQINNNLRFGNFVFFERQGSDYKGNGSHNMGLKWID